MGILLLNLQFSCENWNEWCLIQEGVQAALEQDGFGGKAKK